MNKSTSEGFPTWEPSEEYKNASAKFMTLGFFALTMEDHVAISSTPQSDIAWMPGKPAYELISVERIQEFLDAKIVAMNNPDLVKNGFAQIEKDAFLRDVPFLRSVGKLPSKYEDFDMSSLPDTTRPKDF